MAPAVRCGSRPKTGPVPFYDPTRKTVALSGAAQIGQGRPVRRVAAKFTSPLHALVTAVSEQMDQWRIPSLTPVVQCGIT